MNPHLDRQSRQPPGRWPYPTDDATDRARRVALMYRERLRTLGTHGRAAADQCDEVAVGFGETWMVETPVVIDPDRELTGDLAAELVRVSESTIRKWATQTEHPEQPGQPLLKPFGWHGRRRTYLARDVLAAAVALARARRHI
jgi:hypothetical protein